MNKRFVLISLFLVSGLTLGKIYPLLFSKPYFQPESAPAQNQETVSKNAPKTQPKKTAVIQCKIQGAVKNPGSYSLSSGSRLQDLIQAAGGLAPGAYEKNKNYYLKNGMEFTIKYRNRIQVEIQGEVKNPGIYDLYSGDQLQDLINQAGGLTEFGIPPEKNYYLKDGKRFYIKGRKKIKERIYE